MGNKKRKKLSVPQWTLGDRMRKARVARGIAVGDMAAILTRDRNTITNYETDRTRPPRPIVVRWAEVTQTPLEWIVGDSNPFDWRTPPPPRGGSPKIAWITADELRPTLAAA